MILQRIALPLHQSINSLPSFKSVPILRYVSPLSFGGQMETRPTRKMLLAVRPQDTDLVSEALGTEFDLVICHSLVTAKAALDKDIGLIACGVRFDEGRMLDLLRYVKENTKIKSIPFFCIIGAGKSFSPAVLAGIKKAVLILGANGIVDLSELRKKVGDKQAYETLRQAIRKVLSRPATEKERLT
jgi:hypothetical protein